MINRVGFLEYLCNQLRVGYEIYHFNVCLFSFLFELGSPMCWGNQELKWFLKCWMTAVLLENSKTKAEFQSKSIWMKICKYSQLSQSSSSNTRSPGHLHFPIITFATTVPAPIKGAPTIQKIFSKPWMRLFIKSGL